MTQSQFTGDPDRRPAPRSTSPASSGSGAVLRVAQVIAGLAGAILFVMGVIAVARVDFGASLVETSGSVGGFGFSAVMALAAILLGAITLVTAFADQDRGSTAIIGIITLLVGVGALIAEGQIPEEVNVDRRSAMLFIVLGAVAFVASLVPWFTVRRSVEPTRDATHY